MELEPIAQSVLAEALRNADKHAAPSRVDVNVGRLDGTFFLEVINDGAERGLARHRHGAPARRRGGAPGWRRRGVRPDQAGHWRVRLVVPVRDEER